MLVSWLAALPRLFWFILDPAMTFLRQGVDYVCVSIRVGENVGYKKEGLLIGKKQVGYWPQRLRLTVSYAVMTCSKYLLLGLQDHSGTVLLEMCIITLSHNVREQ